MKRTTYLLLFLFSSSFAIAQTEAKKETNNRIDQQVQEKLDAGARKVMEGLLNNNEVINYEDNYSYNVALLYHIDVFKKNGKKKDHSEMEILVNKTNNCIAMLPIDEEKKEESMVVYDAGNKIILTLITDKNNSKTGIAMNYDPSEVELDDQDQEEITFEKTGEQKEILGYSCQKYISDDEGVTTEYWITEEVDLNMQDVFGIMADGKTNNNFRFNNEYPTGMVMESTSTEKNGTSSTMKIAELDLNSEREINTSGYQMMNMGNMLAPSSKE